MASLQGCGHMGIVALHLCGGAAEPAGQIRDTTY